MTGWKSDETAGEPLAHVYKTVSAETRQALDRLVPQALLESVVAGPTNRAVLISRQGAETPIDDSAAPIRDSAGKITGVVLTFRDVSERQRDQQALQEKVTIVGRRGKGTTVGLRIPLARSGETTST